MRPILKSDADPEGLYWCKFESDDDLICRYGGATYYENLLVGFSRLISHSSPTGRPAIIGLDHRITRRSEELGEPV